MKCNNCVLMCLQVLIICANKIYSYTRNQIRVVTDGHAVFYKLANLSTRPYSRFHIVYIEC